MLEEAIPTLWSTVHSWLTPTMFFLLLNIVIGTIAVTSKSNHPSSPTSASSSAADQQQGGSPLVRAPSLLLNRLRSFNFSHFVSGEETTEDVQSTTDHAPTGEAHQGGLLARAPSNVLNRLRSFDLSRFIAGDVQVRTETIDSEPTHIMDPIDSTYEQEEHERHMGRTLSDVLPPKGKLVKNMKKSASEKSAFDHFKVEDIAQIELEHEHEEEEEEEEGEDNDGGEVDSKADDFINKFRNQLKLQRLDSIIRYKEMLTRGAGY